MLFRSGSMHGLTANDFAYLEKLGLRTVVDFRSEQERALEPVVWPGLKTPTVLTSNYSLNTNPATQGFTRPNMTAQDARNAMAGAYRELPFQLAGQYRAMFAQLKAGQTPLAFNCTAGKDRTGIAAALVLTALGVPRETVISDFLLSNEYYRPPLSAKAPDDKVAAMLSRLPPDALKAIMGVERSYIESTFTTLEARPGGLDGYFRDELGVSGSDIAALRARYLQ